MEPAQARTDETGLSPRVLWTAASILWFVLSAVQIASFVIGFTPKPLPVLVLAISGITPLILSGVWFACARAEIQDIRWFHLPVALGLLVIVLGSVFDPNDHSADVAYPMLPMICALVLFPLAHAWPYVIGGMLGSSAFVVFGADPTPWPRAFVTAVVVLAAAGLLTMGQLQLRLALRRNRELSEIDALTNVANMRRLRARLATEIARARGDADFALMTLDLDDFKSVNDNLGHSTGDRVLVEVARAIERLLEPGEMVARRGGDEFTVIALPRAGRSPEDLRDSVAMAIAATRADLCPTIESSASVGLVWHEHGETVDQILSRADHALHDQKTLSHQRRGGARSGVTAADHLALAGGDDVVGHRLLSRDDHESVRPWQETHAEASWRMIAGVYAALAAIVPLLGAVGPSRGFLAPPLYVICLVSGALAARCLFSEARAGRAARYAALGGTLLVAAALADRSGGVRNATIDMLVLPSMLAFYVAGRRGGALYALAGMGAFAYYMSTVAYNLAVIRTIQTAVVVALVGYLVPHVSKQAHAASDENERLAGVDPLTGLANVRRMSQRLGDELERVQSVGGYVTVFMIDLDDFKQVNDTISHRAGDETLVAVATAVGHAVREGDLVARRGGDEFVAIVAHDGDIEPEALADRIAKDAQAARAEVCPRLNPRVSVGWVTGRPGDTAAELLARADANEKAVKQRHRADGTGLRVVA